MIDPVREALDATSRVGAACDVCLVDQDRLEVEARAGEIDKLTRAHDRVLSLRLFRGQRSATVSSSDVSAEGIRSLVSRARDLADAAEPDPCIGLPVISLGDGVLPDLYCERTASLTRDEAIERALAADRAACGHDPKIQPLGSAAVRVRAREVRLTRSDGFDQSYRSTSATASCVALASAPPEKHRDAAYRTAISIHALPAPEAIGVESARRALGRLGALKIPTTRAAVLYEPRTAATLVEHLARSLVGTAIDQGRSFLADRMNGSIAAQRVNLVDDGRLAGGVKSAPFDGEGVATRRNALIEEGKLRGYLLDSYTSRRLRLTTTGSAQRPLRGPIEPGPSNLFLDAGDEAADAILARTDRGLLVTDLLGFGFDPVTGDYSRGAAGMWIEEGEVRHAVQEVTVAGNLLTMLEEIDGLGDDLTFFGGLGAPTVRFRELTIAGV